MRVDEIEINLENMDIMLASIVAPTHVSVEHLGSCLCWPCLVRKKRIRVNNTIAVTFQKTVFSHQWAVRVRHVVNQGPNHRAGVEVVGAIDSVLCEERKDVCCAGALR